MRKSTKMALTGIIIWTTIILVFGRLLHMFSMGGLFGYEDAKTVWVVGLAAIRGADDDLADAVAEVRHQRVSPTALRICMVAATDIEGLLESSRAS